VHRDIMEKHLRRSLGVREVVHHRDGNPSNNELANLEVKDWGDHTRDHSKPAEWWPLVCVRCGIAFMRRARFERWNRGQGKVGPFCGKSCSGKWSRAEQIRSGRSNLRR
jgi:hypothetical protein